MCGRARGGPVLEEVNVGQQLARPDSQVRGPGVARCDQSGEGPCVTMCDQSGEGATCDQV